MKNDYKKKVVYSESRRRTWLRLVQRVACICVFFLCGLLCAALLTRSGVVSRVKYELTGSEETWEEAALAEGYASSVEEYYYDNMSEDLHEAYREIYVHLMRNEDSGDFLTSISVEDFWQTYYAVLADHPEIFWTDTSAQVEESSLTGTVVSYSFDVTVAAEDRDAIRLELEAAADACIVQIPSDATDYEKIKYVYEYIIDTTDYDLNSEDSQNVQSALLYHSSVCAGYSRAFQYILHRMGLFCTYITGTIVGGGDHGWNMVRIAEETQADETLAGVPSVSAEEYYYYVDVTWGDPVFAVSMDGYGSESTISYNYLCCTQQDLFKTHVPGDSIALPECTSDAYDYYKLNNMYYESFDRDVIYQALMESVQANDSRIMMKFGSEGAYQEAQSALFDGDLLNDAGQYLMQQNGENSWSYRYHTDDNFYLITVYW
ncbi:MAG: hypothetical protein LUF35_03325 [Lachnospiraceae bacterium]|nr:hypothetical protein [Lachnospiraceae bacterium]